MAKVFTTDFEFEHQTYKAIVVIQDSVHQLKIRVRFFEDRTKEIIGDDSIEFEGLTGYKTLPQLQNPLTQQLLDTVSKAILHHLLR